MASNVEAEEFNKTPGNWMGMMPIPMILSTEPTCSSPVLPEFMRTPEEDAYHLWLILASRAMPLLGVSTGAITNVLFIDNSCKNEVA